MELVDGETLAERIARGPIPVDEALPIARQIAEALEAAHEAGMVHRDLKPANIKLRSDGTVKVLESSRVGSHGPHPERARRLRARRQRIGHSGGAAGVPEFLDASLLVARWKMVVCLSRSWRCRYRLHRYARAGGANLVPENV
jgi:serine/threonine protein kinase